MNKTGWDKINLTMLTDFYEITMGNGYFQNGLKDRIAYFDMFFSYPPLNKCVIMVYD